MEKGQGVCLQIYRSFLQIYGIFFAIPEVSPKTCARVYLTHIITRCAFGSNLSIDQERSFISTFFQETFKVLKFKVVELSAWHAMSNGMVERFNRVLRDSNSQDIDSACINWDVVSPFLLIAYRATPHNTTNTVHF